MPFKCRENIVKYLKACQKLGMKNVDIFVVEDLFNGNDLSNVLMQILRLNKISHSVASFRGPYLDEGVFVAREEVDTGEAKYEAPAPKVRPPPQPVKQTPPKPPSIPASVTRSPPAKKNKPPTPKRPSSNKPPARPSTGAPAKRPPNLKSVMKKPENKSRGGIMANLERSVGTGAPPPQPRAKAAPKPRAKPSGAKPKRGGASMADREKELTWWIETVTGESMAAGFHESLKDGYILVKLINTIKKGTTKSVRHSKMPFQCRENITRYIKGCQKLGVPENDVFLTNDLYEDKSRRQVCDNLFALCDVSRKIMTFKGPYVGIATTEKYSRTVTGKERDYIPMTSRGAIAVEKERKLDQIFRQ